jgi:DNA repair protein RecO (recombination protein O)
MDHRRVDQQPAYILHHRPFRDTSQLLDVLSLEHGKLALVARGSRGPRSRLRGVLRPFMPLSLSWVQRSDLGTLTGAEVRGAPLSLDGDALLAGYYVNELLISFLHRHDPQPGIFRAYAETVQNLAASGEVAACLRHFEIDLLRRLGYALNLEHDSPGGRALVADRHYEYRFERGAVAVERSEGRLVFTGAVLEAIDAGRFDEPDVLRAASRLLREAITFHLDGRELKSRKVLVDLRRARMRQAEDEES